jgi:hypothetical protein
MTIANNIRKVVFTAYVQEEDADIITDELNTLYQRSEATLSVGRVAVESPADDDEDAVFAAGFFRDLNETGDDTDDR